MYHLGRVTAVTNQEEFLIKKDHDLLCPNCSKKFINTMTRLKEMFQRSVLTHWCMYSLDRLSLAPFLEGQSSVLVKSHSL